MCFQADVLASDLEAFTTAVAICIHNDEFCIKNGEFCINNDEFCIENDEFNGNGQALATPNAIAALPVVTKEIGDTWIMGLPSDPIKVQRMRVLLL